MLVNGIEIPTYLLDTEKTIISRIAAKFNSLPNYLYFPEGFDVKNKEIKVRDDYNIILKSAKESDDLDEDEAKKELEKLQAELKSNKNLDQKRDVTAVWIANRLRGVGSTIASASTLMLSQTFDEEDQNVINKAWNARETTLNTIDALIERNIYKNNELENVYKIFDKVKGEITSTNLEIDRITVDAVLNLKNISLMELFNYAILSEKIPFVTINNYYKIFKEFIPSEDWETSEENKLICKVNNKTIVDPSKHKDYADVFVNSEGEIGNETITAKMTIHSEKGYLDRTKFLERFSSLFSTIKIEYSSLNEAEILGVFYYPNRRFNTYIFSDLVMNDLLFSEILVVDESAKTTKIKESGNSPWIHIHFTHPNTGRITARISEKFMDYYDPETKTMQRNLFNIGEPYIKVRVKGRDRESINLFQRIFSKLLLIYQEKYDGILEEYRKYIPTFGDPPKPNIKRETEKLSSIASDIFVTNYSRTCPGDKAPKVFRTEQEVMNNYSHLKNPDNPEDPEGYKKRYVKFPRDSLGPDEAGAVYPSDGENPIYIVCPNDTYPYPGLQNNNLSNKDSYPFLPCCFKANQSEKKASLYNQYYKNQEIVVKEKKQQDFMITNKFLSYNRYGILPENIQKFFSYCDSNWDYKYIRIGTYRDDNNKSSFLQCILMALDQLEGSKDDIIATILEHREDLIPFAILAKQCCYDMSVTEIQKYIEDTTQYLSPKKFIQILEEVYRINIYIFNEEFLTLPRFLQGYYSNDRKYDKTVFIYEHWGSESDRATYPHCELIMRWKENSRDDISFLFSESEVVNNVRKIYNIVGKGYTLSKKIVPVNFPLLTSRKIKILSQTVDAYGKCRRIDVNYDNNDISLLLSPIQPINIVENKGTNINIITKEDALRFINDMNGFDIRQCTLYGYTREIKFMSGNIEVYIPVHPYNYKQETKFPVIDSNAPLYFANEEKNKSYMELYNKNKKFARYISEYVFWMFSKYIKNRNIEVISDDVLYNFASSSFEIDEKVDYGVIFKNFSENNNVVRRGKIRVKNMETIKRLMYVLKIYSMRNLKSLLKYHERKVIEQYYADISDFDIFPNQIILYGYNSLEKWLNDNRTGYVLENSIIIARRTPYFFQNTDISNQVFLAQNAESLEQAVNICVEWNSKGNNVGFYCTDVAQASHELYEYVDNSIIKVNEGNSAIKILFLKKDGKNYYTSLLNLMY